MLNIELSIMFPRFYVFKLKIEVIALCYIIQSMEDWSFRLRIEIQMQSEFVQKFLITFNNFGRDI